MMMMGKLWKLKKRKITVVRRRRYRVTSDVLCMFSFFFWVIDEAGGFVRQSVRDLGVCATMSCNDKGCEILLLIFLLFIQIFHIFFLFSLSVIMPRERNEKRVVFARFLWWNFCLYWIFALWLYLKIFVVKYDTI